MSIRKRPNIIWIFGDQHRGQAIGYAGDPNVHTPNLDRLKAEGVACRGAVSGFPLCSPARGSLLTGMYPHKCVEGHERPLPEDQPTIARVFNQAGYHTAYFGKWHVAGGIETDHERMAHYITKPEQRGEFQEWTGYENNNSQYDSWVHGGRGKDAFHDRLPGYETDQLTTLFVDYLHRREKSPDEPFFAVLSVQPPHDPYVAPGKWMQRHTPGTVQLRNNVPDIPRVVDQARTELAGYYAMIENLDWNVGRIREALASSRLAEDTLILFFSDHGDMHGSHGQFRKACPFEEAIRVPFVISGGLPFYGVRNGWSDALLNMPDIAPTTLGLCGIEIPDWMQGSDFSGLRYIDRELPDCADSALLQCIIPTRHPESVDRPWRGIVTRDGWKYVVLEHQPWLLFNLNEDPFELANHALNPTYKFKRLELQNQLAAWLERVGDDFVLPELYDPYL